MALEIQSNLRGQYKIESEGQRERLYSLYSREQEIKVQEGGDSEQWVGSVLRGRGEDSQEVQLKHTLLVYVALCGEH